FKKQTKQNKKTATAYNEASFTVKGIVTYIIAASGHYPDLCLPDLCEPEPGIIEGVNKPFLTSCDLSYRSL
ncbi:hypothetical protein ACQP3J_34100, partial [Escherichia coli]